ncbi:NAD(P)/FAD-dependent oxidoreductase [Nocardioides seonyuensis]|uniref:Pyridine nucleotide-disulfide oxidoreductase domain-containing protein 2 n=1 Tax=Nocardioides seonyuensis TaxID=2518371 RepID=A0A4P7IF62_9ACTN|nr:NAD(P)/FAD-dependent oxidoreductase [Nocardioides seonyuensis]QBX55808.1 NAD(P)/FAD-dependent oxidoreductase [Nocardioides seonyuensis]
MPHSTVDAVVIGAGPNGLVAANALGDADWDVVLVEAQDDVGGAVRSAEVTAPGYVNDLFSAFYPLAAASPIIRDLHLEQHGLAWRQAPDVLSHVLDDGRAAVLRRDPADTAAGLDAEAAGDGEAWLEMYDGWQRVRDPLLDALFTPFPPVAAGARMLRRLGASGGLDFARLAVLPVRRLAEERFRGQGAGLLLTGNALHSDVPPDAAGSGVFGWLLAMLGQDVGFPVPEGGAGRLAQALRARAESLGVEVRTGAEVTEVTTSADRATGVRMADGTSIAARHAVLADVAAPALYSRLLARHRLPAKLLRDLERFHWDNPTIKLNWALERPVPWTAREAAGSGTVHLGVDDHGFVDFAADLSTRRDPERPFLLFGQMTTSDPTRSPEGTESAWAYTHVPHGDWSGERLDRHVERMEQAVERVAPGFRDIQLARHVQSPGSLEAMDANLVDGAVNAGTSALHQQLIFRPVPGLGRPETPVEGLYLAGASAHPGGGVHGACGWNAARAALAHQGRTGRMRRALASTAWARLT